MANCLGFHSFHAVGIDLLALAETDVFYVNVSCSPTVANKTEGRRTSQCGKEVGVGKATS